MSDVDERIIARRREVRRDERARRLRRTMGLLAVAVLVAALLAIERSSLVALDRIEINGAVVVTDQQILDAAALELGTSTVRLRLGPAEERIEALPRIRSVSVQRADPLTVVIDVEERRPVLLVVSDPRSVLVDEDGIIIGTPMGTEPALAIVQLDPGTLLPVGTSVETIPALAAAIAVRRELTGPLRVRVAEYRSTKDTGVTVVLDDDTEVRFGDDKRVDEKARSLGAVLEDLAGRPVATIDVRAPGTPVVVPIRP